MRYIVVGGGIAGVSCGKELARLTADEKNVDVFIITATPLLKETAGEVKITNHLHDLSIYERTAESFRMGNPSIKIVHGEVSSIDTISKVVHMNGGASICYDKLCICSGAQPKMIAANDSIIGIRDLQSVEEMTKRLSSAKKIMVVGNGGIALELINSLTFCDVEWILRDDFLGSSFLDASASNFIMPDLLKRVHPLRNEELMGRENESQGASTASSSGTQFAQPPPNAPAPAPAVDRHQGAALGPEWLAKSKLLDSLESSVRGALGSLTIHYEQDVIAIRNGQNGEWIQLTDGCSDMQGASLQSHQREGASDSDVTVATELAPFPLYVRTSEGAIITCDFLISATGVTPCVDFVGQEFERVHVNLTSSSGADGGKAFNAHIEENDKVRRTADVTQDQGPISPFRADHRTGSIERNNGALVVNERMETSVLGVFAAGDCCHYRASSPGVSAHAASSSGDRCTSPTAVDATALSGTHWFQMRLWTQAHSMGMYAAQCMTGRQDDHGGDFFFDIFAHVTRFFGYKVVLLGRYNAQGLGWKSENAARTMKITGDGVEVQHEKYDITANSDTTSSSSTGDDTNNDNGNRNDDDEADKKRVRVSHPVEIWTRISPGVEYVKVVVFQGKVVGALLLGDTGLEEVFENLILDRLDVSALGADLLDPALDLAEYFD